MRLSVAVVGLLAAIAPALAGEPVTCSTWNGVTTCSGPDGYVSHESTWNGITTGSDNRGDRWSTSIWQDDETTTIEPGPRR
jgi:hypothetical protein